MNQKILSNPINKKTKNNYFSFLTRHIYCLIILTTVCLCGIASSANAEEPIPSDDSLDALTVSDTTVMPRNNNNCLFWKHKYFEAKRKLDMLNRQHLNLQQQRLEHQKQVDQQQFETQDKMRRQARINEVRQHCEQMHHNTHNQMTIAEQSLCHDVNNHIQFGMPITDERLGIK